MTLVAAKKPHHSHRKRTGQHQHRQKHFAKTYWPYLPLLMVVGLGFLANSLWPSQRGVLGYATDMSAQSLLVDTNQQRVADDETALRLNQQLTQAAQAKANDMAAKNYWSHNTPSGQAPWSFIVAAGYQYQTAGENLAYGFDSAASTLDGWMNSPEHRANILNQTYREVGFGIINIPQYQGQGPQTLVVAMYASPVQATVAQATPTSPVQTKKPVSQPVKQPTTSKPAVKAANKPATAVATPSPSTLPSNDAIEPAGRPVSRLQLVASNNASWSVMTLAVIATILLVLLFVRHALAWHRLLIRGERFILHHPWLDTLAVAIVTASFLLSHTAGFIR